MGSDESHLNVSLTVRDKVARQCPLTTTLEEKGEPKRIRTEASAYQPNALPLGQTGSLSIIVGGWVQRHVKYLVYYLDENV